MFCLKDDEEVNPKWALETLQEHLQLIDINPNVKKEVAETPPNKLSKLFNDLPKPDKLI